MLREDCVLTLPAGTVVSDPRIVGTLKRSTDPAAQFVLAFGDSLKGMFVPTDVLIICTLPIPIGWANVRIPREVQEVLGLKDYMNTDTERFIVRYVEFDVATAYLVLQENPSE